MAVVCPTYNIGQFSKPTRIRSSTPRRRSKDYSKPLHVDCSVEYELPNSAKPPTGSKNEPLLMIHPSYYRQEESKHRSHFVNNIPKRRFSSRYCRANSLNTNNIQYGVACVDNRSQFSNCNEDCIVPVGFSPPLPTLPTVVLQKASTLYPEELLAASLRLERCPQPKLISLNHSSKLSEEKQGDLLPSRKRITDDIVLPQSTLTSTSLAYDLQLQCDKSMQVVPASEFPVPVTNSSTARIIDAWFSSCHNFSNRNMKTDNNNNSDKFTNKTKEKILVRHPSAAAANTYNVLAKQQQPAVGVAAIATPLNCSSYCPSLIPSVQSNSHASLPQPWSATTAPELPHASPASSAFQKRSLLLPLELLAGGNTFDSRKRTADVSWWRDGAPDSSVTRRNKLIFDENVYGNVMMENNFCPRDQICYNYNQSCGRNTNIWSRSNENVNLHLFRL